MNSFVVTILNTSYKIFNVAVRTSKSKSYPYGPTRSDLRVNPITKVIDREITPENQDFLKNVVNLTYEDLSKSPLCETPFPRGEWFPGVKRCGVIAKKIGSYPQWLKNGRKMFVTLLQVHDNHVINYLPPEKFAESLTCKSYWKGKFGLITVGTQSVDPRNFSTAYNGLFARAGVMPKAKLTRFVVSPQAAIQPGTPLFANHFKVGHFVDCEAKTIDHGFQGVMKRWGFKGGPKAHGNTKNHRRPGSFGGGKLGDRKSPGTVHKGTKMAGMVGAKFSCTRGLRIWRMNTKHNVLYVHGYAIPGPVNSWVRIFDTRIYAKCPHTLQEAPPFPTYYPENEKEILPENIYHPDLFNYEEPSITYDKNIAAKA